MGGNNPYIQTPDLKKPQSRFSIRFKQDGAEEKTIEIEPSNIPTSATGLPHSILDIALASGIDIDHACGGVCACSTCHIIVEEGLETCSPPLEAEEDQLEKAPGLSPNSRLACQCVPNGEKNLRIKIPSWNRNLVRE